MGATLTLNRTEGNYVLTFTCLFITIVSARFWSIVRLVMHHWYSTPKPRDALHHQKQAVLRNSPSAFDSVLALSSLARAWRHTSNGQRHLIRLTPGILTAFFIAVAFFIAPGFSSQISSGIGNEVLLEGSNCSIAYAVNGDDKNIDELFPYLSRVTIDNANYAQQCYSTETSGVFDCDSFVKPRLPSTVATQFPCPFASGICRSDEANIRIDSGYLDSNGHLGIIAPWDERILFRTVLSCAPLSTEGYSSSTTTTTGDYTAYDYGPKTSGQNFTYKFKSLESQYAADGTDNLRGATFVLA
ncbi:unnamed protein product [Discula destructiva]